MYGSSEKCLTHLILEVEESNWLLLFNLKRRI